MDQFSCPPLHLDDQIPVAAEDPHLTIYKTEIMAMLGSDDSIESMTYSHSAQWGYVVRAVLVAKGVLNWKGRTTGHLVRSHVVCWSVAKGVAIHFGRFPDDRSPPTTPPPSAPAEPAVG